MNSLLSKTFLLLVFVGCCCDATAQFNLDSLKKDLLTEREDTNKVNTLDSLFENYYYAGDYENAMQTAQKQLALATKINYKIGIADGHLSIGLAYGIKKDSLNESQYFNKALALYKATGNVQQIALCYDWISQQYQTEEKSGKALEAAYAALKVREQTGNKTMIAYAYLNFSYTYANTKDYASKLNYLSKALALFKVTGDKQGVINAYDQMREAYLNEGYKSKVFECAYAGQKIREQTGDKKTIADGFMVIATCFGNYIDEDSSYPKEELKNILSALKLYKELNDRIDIGGCISSIGFIYFWQGKYADALDKSAESLEILKDGGRLNDIAGTFAVIGNIYKAQGDSAYNKGNKVFALSKYREAEKNQLFAVRKWLDVGYKPAASNCYYALGELNIKFKNLNTAKKYFDSSLAIDQSIGLKGGISGYYRSLAQIDSIRGNYKDAYKNYQLYKIYHDSSINEEDEKKAVQVQMQYDFDKKEAIVKAAQNKKDADAKRIKNQQLFTILALGIIVLAVIIIAAIQFRNNKQKQKANKVLQTTLSDLKSTQAQLIQSEKMASLGELTAGIAHEIQNPLNFVNNFSEVNNELIEELKAERSTLKAEKQDELLNDIFQNNKKINMHGKRADAIVKGMLQHSKQTKGVKEPTDINALCDEYLRLSYHGLRAKDKSFNADFKTDFDETIGKINIVPQDIGRVLLNLFNNAFYTVSKPPPPKGVEYKPLVSVSTRQITPLQGSGAAVEIVVTDNGNGIPSNIIDKIFQPFFTTKPTGQGTGLGLSLAYDIITKEHNGTIKVESKEGEGSTFIINLPVI